MGDASLTLLRPLRQTWRRVKTRWLQLQGRELRYPVETHVPRMTLGNLDAHWTFCPTLLDRSSVIYSVGIGTDISFDLALIERLHAEVHAFDPTPRSLEWLETQPVPPQFHFHPWGLADYDGTASFEPPADATHVSFRIVNGARPTAVDCEVRRLTSIMRKLGHDRVDLLKLDIEGAELRVLPDLLASGVAVRQLLVEFHHRGNRAEMVEVAGVLRMLSTHGFRIFNVSENAQEISFVREGA